MRHGRGIWAVIMSALAMVVLAGYTLADGTLPMELVAEAQEPTFAALQILEPEEILPVQSDQSPAPMPEDVLEIVVRDESGAERRKLMLIDEQGERLCVVVPNKHQEYVLKVSPGNNYTLKDLDDQTVTFFVEENAAVTNVTGAGWSDGEVLHLDSQLRCTLHVVGTAIEEPALYTLTGEDYAQSQALLFPEGETEGRTVFTGLQPGTYILTGADGTERTVELTEQQSDVTVGLD